MPRPRFEMRPLLNWPGPTTDPRRSGAQFRARWDDTVALLLDEVGRLDGGMVVVQVDTTEDRIRRDGMLHARAVVTFPGVRVSFDSRHGPLTYATDAYESWQANVRAVALGLGALRAVDRYGIAATGEQYRGWTAIAGTSGEFGMTREQAADLLAFELVGVDPVNLLVNPDAADRSFRRQARKHHPDVGGDAELFRRLTAARDLLVGGGRG